MWSFFCIVPSFQGIYFDNLCQFVFPDELHWEKQCVCVTSVCVCAPLLLKSVCENIVSCDGTVH